MQGQLIPIAQAGPDLIAEWQALAARAVEPNPWFEPHVVVSLATMRDDICLLVARHESRLRACVVLTSASKSWYGIRLPMWLTPHPMGTPLVDVEDGEEGLRCAFDFLSRSRGPRFLMLQEIDAEGRVAAMVTRALSRGWTCRTMRTESAWPILRRRPQPTYLESMRSKHRYNTGRLRRRLEQHLGSELRLVARSDDAGIERFLDLEAGGWKGRRGTALACDPVAADYFRRACRGFAQEGRLYVHCLESGTTTVAMKVMVGAGDGLFDFRVAYDERFTPFSPGVLLEIEVVQHFHAGERAWILSNTNHPGNPVRRIWPEQRAIVGVLAECPGVGRQVFNAVLRRGARSSFAFTP